MSPTAADFIFKIIFPLSDRMQMTKERRSVFASGYSWTQRLGFMPLSPKLVHIILFPISSSIILVLIKTKGLSPAHKCSVHRYGKYLSLPS
eukprot:Gb_32520 [translate_table: standard]